MILENEMRCGVKSGNIMEIPTDFDFRRRHGVISVLRYYSDEYYNKLVGVGVVHQIYPKIMQREYGNA
jgi:hypothetical protein